MCVTAYSVQGLLFFSNVIFFPPSLWCSLSKTVGAAALRPQFSAMQKASQGVQTSWASSKKMSRSADDQTWYKIYRPPAFVMMSQRSRIFVCTESQRKSGTPAFVDTDVDEYSLSVKAKHQAGSSFIWRLTVNMSLKGK